MFFFIVTAPQRYMKIVVSILLLKFSIMFITKKNAIVNKGSYTTFPSYTTFL